MTKEQNEQKILDNEKDLINAIKIIYEKVFEG